LISTTSARVLLDPAMQAARTFRIFVSSTLESRPLLFLDVDGVIGRFGVQAEGRGRRIERTGYLPLDVDERIAGWLRSLDEAFEVVWATSWFEDANGILPALGLELSWPVLAWTERKLPEILELAGERPFAWVDDDVQRELDQLRDRGEAPNLGERRLLIRPDPARGLTESHVEELLAFAAGTHGRPVPRQS
jgi:hypothetical protein